MRLRRLARWSLVSPLFLIVASCGGGDNTGTGGSGGAGGVATGTGGGGGEATGGSGGTGGTAGGVGGAGTGGAAGAGTGGTAGVGGKLGTGGTAGAGTGGTAGVGGKLGTGGTAGAGTGGTAGVGGKLGTGGTAGAGTGGTAGGTGGAAGSPPAMLTATVTNRRQTLFSLAWTAPSVNGQPATGYQVRYATVPITTANFDNTAVTIAIPTTQVPKAPGMADGLDVQLYIENAYYFAVEGTDGSGNRSALDATTTAVSAHFNVATLTGTTGSSTEGAGYALDGSGDANGDGKSDVLMGSYNGMMAYLFFGSTSFAPTAPSVVFSSTSAGFGRGVAFIGDIDHDGREDLAIANRTTEVVYIYKGRATWPATLTDAQADYTITADSTYASSQFGSAMVRLGDFDGDGIDDFAIGSPNFSTNLIGRVTIILGSATFGSVTLPSATKAIIIDGEATLTDGAFGASLTAIDPFYANASTLIVGAPGFVGAPSGTAGKIYAFHGQKGTAGAIAASAADASITGASAGMRIGAVLANVGVLGGGVASVASGNPNDTTAPGGGGSVFAFSGDTTAGPFGSHKTLYFTGETLVGSQIIGGGVAGRNATLSFIGDTKPDLVMVARNGTKFGIVDGDKLTNVASPIDASGWSDVIVTLPAGWNTSVGIQSLVRDIDGDGYPDFAISNAASTVAGQVLVYW
jgi:hypothetical protein